MNGYFIFSVCFFFCYINFLAVCFNFLFRFHFNAGVIVIFARWTHQRQKLKWRITNQKYTSQTNIYIYFFGFVAQKNYVCDVECADSIKYENLWALIDSVNSHFLCVHSEFRLHIYTSRIYVVPLHLILKLRRFGTNMKSLNIIIIRNKIILNSKSSIVIKVCR